MLKFDDDVDALLAEAAALDARFSAEAAAAPPIRRDPPALLNLCRAIGGLTDDLRQLSLDELLSVERALSDFRHRVEASIALVR